MIKSTYNKEENIIYVERHGEIELSELLENINNSSKYFNNLSSLYVIEDVRKSITKFKEKDYVIIINTLKDLVKNYDEVRSAIIVNNPYDTALSLLYEKKASEIRNYSFKTFSTIDAAKRWLKQGIFYNFL